MLGANKNCDFIVRLIVQKHVSFEHEIHNQKTDDLVEKIIHLTHVRLDRAELTTVPRIDFLPRLTNLYLHHNNITLMKNLECLPHLRFLSLAFNKISNIEGIQKLHELGFLDLSKNCIEHLDVTELPQSIVIVNLFGNPCTNNHGYRQSIESYLENVKSLDNVPFQTNESSSDGEEDNDEDEINQTGNVGTSAINKPSAMLSKETVCQNLDKKSIHKLKVDIETELHRFSRTLNETQTHLQEQFESFAISKQIQTASDIDLKEDLDSECNTRERDDPLSRLASARSCGSVSRRTPHPPPSRGQIKEKTLLRRAAPKPERIHRIRTPGARPIERTLKLKNT